MDPLAQLRDIHLPDSISAWPPAIGWWILAGLVIACVVSLIVFTLRYLRKNKYRKVAKKQLNQIYQSYQNDNNIKLFSIKINRLLKQVSVNAYHKKSVSKLSGSSWLSFLDGSGKTNDFRQGAGKILATIPYSEPDQVVATEVDSQALYQLCKQWIKQHRVLSETELEGLTLA